MSLITDDPDKSPRDCSRRKRRKWWIAASSSTVLLLLLALFILSIILILWMRPSRPPEFSLLAATASNNNASSVTLMVVDAAFSARNPNAHAAVLYEELRLSAAYAGVALRGSAPLEGDEEMMSASLRSPWTASGAVGGGLLRTRIEGQLRWKVGAWVSGRHGLAVDCVVVLLPSSSFSSQSSHCATHVLMP